METDTILEILESYPGAYFHLNYEGYAEPGHADPDSGLIAIGDWNPRSWDEPIPKQDQTMPRIGVILEKLGVELEWEDEWITCYGCDKLIRTQPNSYSWTRSYWKDGCDIYCHECVLNNPEDYLKYLEGNPRAANTLNLNLEDQGYRRVDGEYENGLYGGQCDDPHEIAKSLGKLSIGRYIFEIDGVGQFDLSFSVWVHKSEYGKLDPDKVESKGADPAVAMRSALCDASAKMRVLDGSGVKVAKCHADGTATVKLVSQQDFTEGKALD